MCTTSCGAPPIHLRLARDHARLRRQERLAAYFEHKLGEEEGHDAWAARDIARISERSDARGAAAPVPTMRELIVFLQETIEKEPMRYLAYILFAEYFTVVMGPEWVRALEQHCGIPTGAMTVITNHAELDKAHVAEGVAEIDALVGESDRPALMATLSESMTHFERFLDELARPGARAA